MTSTLGNKARTRIILGSIFHRPPANRMADDTPEQQRKPARQVHFEEDPVSNVFIFQRPTPNIILRLTPLSPHLSAARETSTISPPTLTAATKRSHRDISPSLEPSRSEILSTANTLSSGIGDLLGGNAANNEQKWSLGHVLGGIEDSKTSQTPSASPIHSRSLVPQS